MQNRLVLTGIPPSVPRLPNAHDSLRELVEAHACWVDRFAFLVNDIDDDADATSSSLVGGDTIDTRCTTDNGSDIESSSIVVAIELHIENVRDKAIKSLDGLGISMDSEGNVLELEDDGNSTHEKTKAKRRSQDNILSFIIQAHPASKLQSAMLINKCTLESDDVDAERRMEKQTLILPLLNKTGNDNDCIELTVRRSIEHGGTGTFPWRGGLILSKQICYWAQGLNNNADSIINVGSTASKSDDLLDLDCNTIDFRALFCNKEVLELGAGAAGIPSMTLGKIGNILGYQKKMNLVASDGVDEIVDALQVNVDDNGLEDYIQVKHIDWNDFVGMNIKEGVTVDAGSTKVDTIIFADCIYNEECATALSQTIHHLLKPGGYVIGVLPDFRVGLDIFEAQMTENMFNSINVPVVNVFGEKSSEFACSGGGGKEYRLMMWKGNE